MLDSWVFVRQVIFFPAKKVFGFYLTPPCLSKLQKQSKFFFPIKMSGKVDYRFSIILSCDAFYFFLYFLSDCNEIFFFEQFFSHSLAFFNFIPMRFLKCMYCAIFSTLRIKKKIRKFKGKKQVGSWVKASGEISDPTWRQAEILKIEKFVFSLWVLFCFMWHPKTFHEIYSFRKK